MIELKKYWRQRRLSEFFSFSLLKQNGKSNENEKKIFVSMPITLSGDGFPLNPNGRTGLAGRGEYTRFGPNTLYFYIIFAKDKSGALFVSINKKFYAINKFFNFSC